MKTLLIITMIYTGFQFVPKFLDVSNQLQTNKNEIEKFYVASK